MPTRGQLFKLFKINGLRVGVRVFLMLPWRLACALDAAKPIPVTGSG